VDIQRQCEVRFTLRIWVLGDDKLCQ